MKDEWGASPPALPFILLPSSFTSPLLPRPARAGLLPDSDFPDFPPAGGPAATATRGAAPHGRPAGGAGGLPRHPSHVQVLSAEPEEVTRDHRRVPDGRVPP